MSDPFPQQIVPLPQPEVAEVLIAHQMTVEFHQEVRLRAALEDEYQRYQRLVKQHRHELAAMQHDINLFAWFSKLWR